MSQSQRTPLDPATMAKETTPGGSSSRELSRNETQRAHSFAISDRPSNHPIHRRPYVPWAPPPEPAAAIMTGAWPPAPLEKPFTKLAAIDSNEFRPVNRVAEARFNAQQLSLRELKRSKQSRLIKFRAAPMVCGDTGYGSSSLGQSPHQFVVYACHQSRATMFTECSGPGSGLGMGYKGGNAGKDYRAPAYLYPSKSFGAVRAYLPLTLLLLPGLPFQRRGRWRGLRSQAALGARSET